MMEEAIALTEQADFFAVIGTSLAVYPAASLIDYVPPGVPTFLIDPQPTRDGGHIRVFATASLGVPLLMASACRAPFSLRIEQRTPSAQRPRGPP